MTVFTLGSAFSDTSLTTPVVRSATSADLLSSPMIRPLVLSRQPCITPGAGQALGNGLPGSGGGGGGVDVGGGVSSGSVVNGWDWASSKRAQPANDPDSVMTSPTVRAATTPRTGGRIGMQPGYGYEYFPAKAPFKSPDPGILDLPWLS